MDVIISPDMGRRVRIPPGQSETRDFPVLHYGRAPRIDERSWSFRIFGLVEKELSLTFEQFMALPRVIVKSDIHCVTGWSRLDNVWEGVAASAIIDLVHILDEACYAIVHADSGFTANLTIEEFRNTDVLFAVKHNGAKITPDHGYPVRLVVPRLYFWKSAKWTNGVEFTAEDRPGFWETRGYHNHGDPWKEERYG
jgi:DMSO/TMAO reductase YedYZ molybdopterin-dependent catalytic subunit